MGMDAGHANLASLRLHPRETLSASLLLELLTGRAKQVLRALMRVDMSRIALTVCDMYPGGAWRGVHAQARPDSRADRGLKAFAVAANREGNKLWREYAPKPLTAKFRRLGRRHWRARRPRAFALKPAMVTDRQMAHPGTQ